LTPIAKASSSNKLKLIQW